MLIYIEFSVVKKMTAILLPKSSHQTYPGLPNEFETGLNPFDIAPK